MKTGIKSVSITYQFFQNDRKSYINNEDLHDMKDLYFVWF